jgi:methionyl aminopeptidase
MVSLKTPSEVATMREAGRFVARVLAAVAAEARPGVRLIDLDALAADMIAEAGARSSFLGYRPTWAPTPYPGVLCLSLNDEIVHGIPDKRALSDGDLTVAIGSVDEAGQRLSAATSAALDAGIAAAQAGARIGDIAHAIETVARHGRYGQPPGIGGHGVGTAMHEDPSVPNSGRPGRGMVLAEGLTIAIEPMLIEGGRDRCRTGADGWTVLTTDGSRAAHFEHTIAITADGPLVLTAP